MEINAKLQTGSKLVGYFRKISGGGGGGGGGGGEYNSYGILYALPPNPVNCEIEAGEVEEVEE
ncbi:MAG: hypothetical protein II453_12415 [Alphaproteobacteria bacterium]|nr:hypothetical protein [Alphaproteobacteria bacterium]